MATHEQPDDSSEASSDISAERFVGGALKAEQLSGDVPEGMQRRSKEAGYEPTSLVASEAESEPALPSSLDPTPVLPDVAPSSGRASVHPLDAKGVLVPDTTPDVWGDYLGRTDRGEISASTLR